MSCKKWVFDNTLRHRKRNLKRVKDCILSLVDVIRREGFEIYSEPEQRGDFTFIEARKN